MIKNNSPFSPHKIDSTTDGGIFPQMRTDLNNADDICEEEMLEAEDTDAEPPPIQVVNLQANMVDQYPEL